jgi:hypothetical protein
MEDKLLRGNFGVEKECGLGKIVKQEKKGLLSGRKR